jgi:hypothetical protein
MRRLFLFVLFMTLALAPGDSVRAENPVSHHKKPVEDPTLIPAVQPVVATYDIYVGGIHLLTADILFEEGAHKYHVQVKGQTYGLWYRVFPWNTELNANGAIKSDRFVPVEYATHDLWGKKSKTMKLHFGKNDVTSEYDPPEHDDKDKDLTPEQKEGALDPVTALLQMLAHVAITNNCDVTVPVFDGKRRFDVTAIDSGTEYIDEDDYGVYKGDARLCDAKFKAVAGEWTEKIKARFWKKSDTGTGDDREPFHVWLAQIAPGMPELAVRIETGSAWGDVIMHLTKWRPAGPEDGIGKANAS